ncbi:alkane hydroxylase MAH1-like [Silene latifolia]|uniref:alkane hydroxylase MAH1-like n=1 Tax=Silene latifolia TaxID=37657 RepID=UPI003D779EE3
MDYLIEISFIFVAVSLVFLYNYYHDKNGIPTNWPIVGMLPALFLNLHNIHDYVVEVVEKTQLNFVFKGPWLANMQIFVTVDPANVHHIMSKNFGNYPKGPKFNEIFDVLGDGISNSDSPMWEYQRKMAKSFVNHSKFHENLVKKVEDKIESGLKPILDNVSNQGIEIDLQDLFGRLTFDTSCTVLIDFDPKSLSIEMPIVPSSKAFDDLEEAILYRHAMPPSIWKFQRWLSIGREKKFKQAWKNVDDFIYNCIAIKRSQKVSDQNSKNNDMGVNLFTLYTEAIEENNTQTPNIKKDDDKLLRDSLLNLVLAGRDTISVALSWFFYLLSKNARVETKLREEVEKIMSHTQDFSNNSRELCNKLVYLHASLCETLRLYPPVVFESKSPVEPDILPSGHTVSPNMQIIFSLYAMGRMKSIWGDDCHEFKPERWISEEGNIRHEPSYKFLAFNAGPRTCVGKDMAFTEMKIVAATVLRNYRIEPVDGFQGVPDISIILHMKYGFKVKVSHLR